jgi:hypothetical protein
MSISRARTTVSSSAREGARTRNRARDWKELLAAGTDGLTEVAFADPRHGYLAASDRFFAKGSGRPDYVLRTSDGGRRWRPQIVSASRDINSLVAIDSRRALLLAGDHLLFRTGSGGDRGDHSGLSLRPSKKVLAGPGSVRLSGAIRPAAPGEHLTVAMRSLDPRARLGGSLDWSFKSARVSSSGRFASTWRIRRTSVFVAQWTGNSERAGSGSTVVKVIVRRRWRTISASRGPLRVVGGPRIVFGNLTDRHDLGRIRRRGRVTAG